MTDHDDTINIEEPENDDTINIEEPENDDTTDNEAPRNNGYLAIPDDSASILARGNPRTIKLADRVERAYFSLRDFGTEEAHRFRECRQACTNDLAVEGHLKADDYESARLLRDHARIELGDAVIAGETTHEIARVLGVVERRFKISRNERRRAGQ